MLTRIYDPSKKETGFTLVELLVVIIIIGILAAVAIPLFLDQRKLAADAAVKSDVRNTSTQVQTWLSQNPGTVATDATAYTNAGGKVVASNGDAVGVSIATDGTYLVCGYTSPATGKVYNSTSAAYVFDSTTGRFGTGSCSGGIVGGGSPSATATPTPTPTIVAPQITSPAAGALPNAQTTVAYSTFITATGDAPLTYSATGLPAGLSIVATTGEIKGTPTATGTSSNVVVTVSNNGTPNATRTYTLTVQSAPSITPSATELNAATKGVSYSQTFTVAGAPTPTLNVTAGALPAGLSLVGTTLSGTPTGSGMSNFTLTASNGVGSNDVEAYSLYVAPVGTSADRVPAPTTDTVFWSRMIANKLPGYRYTGGANTATSSGIVSQPGGNFLSVTRYRLPVPASHKIQVTYTNSGSGVTPYLVPEDANGNFVGTGSGDGTWYVWTSGNVITLPANVTTYDVAVPNWSQGSNTLTSIHVIEQ